ncbi:techylectin-5A [Trichonephila clavipes]|nr:techylectin-5A [Trichonephila clavipes]
MYGSTCANMQVDVMGECLSSIKHVVGLFLSLESLLLLKLFRGRMILHCISLLFWILPAITCEKFEETEEKGGLVNVADVIESLNSKEVFKCVKHSKPMDCKEVLENGNTESGVYTIWPRSRHANCEAIEVYCDLETAGGGWTVIQRRGDYGNAQNYFDKTWKDYKEGFGNLRWEFWLGDALTPHSGKEFYTKDQPNTPSDVKHGAVTHTGGWWFNTFTSSTLNGLNNNGEKLSNVQQGMSWNPFGGYSGSLVFSEIKVRPRKF